jgi:hypothetical protein
MIGALTLSALHPSRNQWWVSIQKMSSLIFIPIQQGMFYVMLGSDVPNGEAKPEKNRGWVLAQPRANLSIV